MKVRPADREVLYAIVAANNQRMVDQISTSFHLDRTLAPATVANGSDYKNPPTTRLTVTLAAATDAATQLALTNELRRVWNIHAKDDIAHDTATSPQVTLAVATDATTANAVANDIKSKFGTHLSAVGVHFTNDATNTIAAANATDATTLQTLVNEIRTDLIAHMASAPAGVYIDARPSA